MTDKAKPFLSENNPLNMETYKGEGFSYKYFFPQYWLGWIIIILSFILTYLPKIFRDSIGTFLGFFIYKTNHKRKKIVQKNLAL
ncbi:MAG: hypothetical protein VX440_00590, partial [Pseudomonadota bacterium]|nr:hypothetical protein [Pseudomonadota bacterium]